MTVSAMDSSSVPDPFEPILESFLGRLRRGERPSIQEYVERYPEYADGIYELFPPLVEMEQASLAGDARSLAARSVGGVMGALAGTGLADDREGPALQRLGDYKILRKIGGGGMGIVYEAERVALRNRVALKVMHPRFRDRPDHLRWFLREARAAAKLHHQNIVTVFDWGVSEGVAFYAMQYIAGHSLDQVLADVKRLEKGEAAAAANGKQEPGGRAEQETQSLEPNPAGAPPGDPALRTVSRGLLAGTFDFRPSAATEYHGATTAAAPGTSEASHPARSTAGNGDDAVAQTVTPEDGAAIDAASSLSFVSNSTSGSGFSWRYQKQIARLGAQVADALEFAHKRGVIHRDIKPHNILLDALGNAWITDFGLATLKQEEDRTNSQGVAGTLRYMAPERLQGKSDGRDDIYALGATLYEFLALRPLFDGSDPHVLLHQIEHEQPVPLRKLDRRIHPDLAAIVATALAKDPADRYATAGELRDELRRFLEGRPVKRRPVPPYTRFWRWCKRNPWLATANISAAATTTALAIGMSIAAKVYHDGGEKMAAVVDKLKVAETQTREQLFEAKVERARAGRFSHRVGQRFESLDALTEAAKIGRQLGLPAERFVRLRDEAIACMALPDMKPAGPPIHKPEGTIAFAFDAGMTRYAVRLRDGTILVRRMGDDQEIARFTAQGDRDIWVFAFSPDGRYLASQDRPGGAVVIRDVDQGIDCVRDPGPVSGTAARFRPDSQQIAIAHDDGSLVIHDLKSGQGRLLRQGPGPAQDLAFRPDGKEIAVVYWEAPEATCQILDADTGKQVRSISLPSNGSVSWSPDGTTLAIAGWDTRITLWNAATGERSASLEGHTNQGLRTAFHPAGTLLASNGNEGQLRIWDPVLGRPVLSVADNIWPDFSHDGQIFLERDNRLTPWQVDPALEYRTLAHASNQPLNFARPSIHRGGRILAVGTDRGVVLWDLARGTELAFLPIGMAWHSMFEPSGELLTNGSAGVLRWPMKIDPTSGETRIGPPQRLSLPGTDCAIAEDASGQIVAVARHNAVHVAVGDRTIVLGPLDDCRYVSVSPDGQWLATGNHQDGGVSVWSLPGGARVATLAIVGGSGAIFSPDGKWLVSVQGSSRLWEVGTWREVTQFDGVFRGFSPDGRLGVVLDAIKVLGLVEIATGRTLARLESPDQHQVEMAAFSPDGSRLVETTHEPNCAHVWDLRHIRRRLTEMGLDWVAPAYPEADPASADLPPLLPPTVDYGQLAGKLQLPPEELKALVDRYSTRIAQDPNDSDAYHQRALAFVRLNRITEAIDDLTHAIRLRPDDAQLLHSRAELYAGDRKNQEPAIADLEAALMREPSRPGVRELLALCCNNQAWFLVLGHPSRPDVDRALALSQRAVELAPEQQTYLNTRGVVLYRAEKYAEALTVLAKSLVAGHGQSDGFDLFFLAMAHHRLGHRDEARQCLNRAIAWVGQAQALPAEQLQELAAFRAEAEAVLAGPAGELPDEVFAQPGTEDASPPL